MDKCEIYFSRNDELTETEVIEAKGWRGDVLVKIGNKLYNPIPTTPERLLIDFNNDIEMGYAPHFYEGTIIVQDPNRNEIIKVVLSLLKTDFFNKMKPIDLEEEFATCFTELQKLENWVKVY